MKPVTLATGLWPGPLTPDGLASLSLSGLVSRTFVARAEDSGTGPGCEVLSCQSFHSGGGLALLLDRTDTEYLLLLPGGRHVTLEGECLGRLIDAARSTNAGLVYADFFEETLSGRAIHPLNDYQPGSVRDDFDFGEVLLFSVPLARQAAGKHGFGTAARFAGLYDLRLKLSIDHPLVHLKEPLYSVEASRLPGDATRFAYVDPRNSDVQKEMESVFTDYLKRIGAYLPPGRFTGVLPPRGRFPVEASVVIPVRNRRRTVADAVESALSQKTDFPFNVIVVDNHSTDGTTSLLGTLAARHAPLVHLLPARTDLGIGGCWNEAIQAHACGRYAVQLDSDDLYEGADVLQRLVDTLRQGSYAMVVGAYRLVDSGLREIPPGLVDHREWTDENGRNNALRVNGVGAPRAFDTAVLRLAGFPNVSYGEDYAAALRISREYPVGRIYESLYLCRRWAGNTDAGLTIEKANQNDAFKDGVRTGEIAARKRLNEAYQP